VFGSELDQLFVLMVVVRIEKDLLEVSLRVSVSGKIRMPGLQRG
jgi:hypothetical protein